MQPAWVEWRGVRWGPNGTRVVAAESYWKQPLKWDREAAASRQGWERAMMESRSEYDAIAPYQRPRVFCASLADVFEDWKGRMRNAAGLPLRKSIVTTDEWIPDTSTFGPEANGLTMHDVRNRLFALIDATPNLDYLLLTKRPENVLRMTYDAWCKKVPGHVSQNEGDGRRWAWPCNVWLGVSVEDQARADERIPLLLATPAAVRFLSCEPLLGPVKLPVIHDSGEDMPPHERRAWGLPHTGMGGNGAAISWVIIGGESGPKARPCNVAWIRSIVQQCQAAGVPVFVKQLGSLPSYSEDDPGPLVVFSGKNKGGDISEFPKDLRVREFPKTAVPT